MTPTIGHWPDVQTLMACARRLTGLEWIGVFLLREDVDVAPMHCRALDAAKVPHCFVTRWNAETYIVAAAEERDPLEKIRSALEGRN